jgi:hypothetical protein
MTTYQRIKQRWFKKQLTASVVHSSFSEDEAKPEAIAEESIPYQDPQPLAPEPLLDPGIDFNLQGDLETYAKGLKIPVETIEKWISAGLLFPDEIKAAQKILRIMRKKH